MAERRCARVVHRLALLAAGVMAAASAAAASGPGDLDTAGFNSQGSVPGTVATDFGSVGDQANALVLQPDGKLVAAGTTVVKLDATTSVEEFALARYDTDGTLDSNFNFTGTLAGTVTTAFGGNSPGDSQANALIVQPDGKLVAAGTAKVAGTKEFAAARYLSDGTLDTSFNSPAGTVTTAFSGDAQVNALALQTDGKLVAAGYSTGGNGYTNITLARYNPDGSLDTKGFNAGGSKPGIVSIDLGGEARATAVILRPDGQGGKILVAGYRTSGANTNFVLVRFDGDGGLDTSFNSGGAQPGVATTDLGGDDRINALALQPDAKSNDVKIVAAGRSDRGTGNSEFALARYGSDGVLDTTFNPTGSQPGTVSTDINGYSNGAVQALAVQPDGKLVAVGYVHYSALSKFALARYNTDGGLDTTFNPSGSIPPCSNQCAQPGTLVSRDLDKTGFEPGVGNQTAYGVALDPSGKIVLAGFTDNGVGNDDFFLARFFATDSDAPWQLDPQPFTLDNDSGAVPGAVQTSNMITVQGLPAGFSVPVLVSGGGGEYAKNGSSAYTSAVGWAQDGDQFNVRHTASSQGGRSVTTKLSIGGLATPNNAQVAVGPAVSDSFTSITDRGPRITGTPSPTTQATTFYSFVPLAMEQDSGERPAPCGQAPGSLVFSIKNKPSWAHFDKACGELAGFPGSVGTDSGIVISVADSKGVTASLPPFSIQATNDSYGSGLLGPVSLAALAWAGWRQRRRRAAQ